MKLVFTQFKYKGNFDISINEVYTRTIAYSEGKSIVAYISDITELNDIKELDDVSFFFQGGEKENEEMIITFMQVTEIPIIIPNVLNPWLCQEESGSF